MKNLIYITLLCCFFGCSSTKIVSSWKDPDSSFVEGQFGKVIVVALSPNELNRRIAEDKIASESENLYASYNYLDKNVINDEEKTKEIFKKEAFDGVMMLKLIEQKEEQTYVPGSSYTPRYYGYGYAGYHSAYWGGYYEPGYYKTDKKYFIETSVFSLKKDKLLWSGITSTVNPSKVERAIDEITFVTYRQMKKDGFITDK